MAAEPMRNSAGKIGPHIDVRATAVTYQTADITVGTTSSSEWRSLIEGVDEGSTELQLRKARRPICFATASMPSSPWASLQAWNATNCKPPLPAAEVRADRELDRQQGTAEARQWLTTSSSSPLCRTPVNYRPVRKTRLALDYAERHVVNSRYVAAWSRWLLYDGARWIFDTTLHAFDRARAICREFAPECAKPAAVMTAKTVRARRTACSGRSPSRCNRRAMGREPFAAGHRTARET